MYSRTEVITPERAKELISRCDGNFRKLNPRKVSLYVKDMKAGRWAHNGESIKISTSGRVVDGQNRLHAVVMSGATITSEVTYGVSDDVITFDIGEPRTASQALKALGVPNAASNNSTVGAAAIFLNGAFRTNNVASKPSITEFIYCSYEEWAAAKIATCACGAKPICKKSPVILAAFILLKTGVAQDELAEFFEIVNTGFPKDGRESSPAIVLRNQLITKNPADGPTELRLQQFAATVEAFKDYHKGVRRRQCYRKTEDAEVLFMRIRAAELGEENA